MTWLITESSFDLVVGPHDTYLYGYTHRHEWLAYGEGLTPEEQERVRGLPLQWTMRAKGNQAVSSYLALSGQKLDGAATAVRMPSDAIIVACEVSQDRWSTMLRAFEVYVTATYPKHFRINVPFESLSERGERSFQLEQFLSGDMANATVEEAAAVFFYGSELPEQSSS
jgi:hypothetical protein